MSAHCGGREEICCKGNVNLTLKHDQIFLRGKNRNICKICHIIYHPGARITHTNYCVSHSFELERYMYIFTLKI